MERPNHDLQGMGVASKKSRAVSLAVTVGVQVAAVLALMAGLATNQIRKELLDINASVVKAKVIPKAPPPPPPDLVRPPPPTAVVPQFAIEAPRPAAPAPPPAAPAPPARIAPTKLEAIERTHTIPPYPPISQRMGEQGTVLIKVTIGTDGKVTEDSIEKSSGSKRLDDAAVEWVRSNWRWQPPTQDGKPVVATTLISVKFDLKNAQ